MQNEKEQAQVYLDKNKDRFKSEQKYFEAQSIINNSNKRFRIKGIFFLDYINKIL